MSFESLLHTATARLANVYSNERLAARILAVGLCALLLFGTASMPLGIIAPQASAATPLPIALVDTHELINPAISPQTLAESPGLPFVLNEGQVHSDVHFYVDTFAGRVYVTDQGLTYSLKSAEGTVGLAIKENFVQSNQLQPYGTDQSKAVVNYYAGEQSNWRSNIATFDKVSFGEVWNGIDVKLNAASNNVEKIFTVAPGASINDIQVAAEGVNSLSVNYQGQLVLATELGEVTLTKPVAFQEINGQIKSVEVSYVVGQNNQYGFVVGGEYDPNFALVIDPLLASTYLGGTENEGVSPNSLNPSKGAEIAFDSGGDVYIASLTLSDNYPTTTSLLPDPNFNSDVVVSKLNSDLTTLIASTYISGNNLDEAVDIAIDSSGSVYITGRTNSTDYPTTSGAWDEDYNGGGPHGNHDGFVTKLDSNLVIEESSYLGGNDQDEGFTIAINSAGDVYVAGTTFSEDYPTTAGAYDTTFNAPGQAQAFITALDDDLSVLITSTLLGGSNDSAIHRLAINATDHVFTAGFTLATNFPIIGGFDSSKSGTNQHDTFIAIFDDALTTLERSTFLGDGSVSGHHTTPFGLAVSSDGKVYVAGLTRSPNFPTTPGAYDTSPNTTFRTDAYISVLPNSLDSLVASTVIGSDATNEGARGLAITDSAIYIVALAGTAITSWPVTPGAFHEVGNESYITKLNLGLTSVLASTSIGGGNTDILEAIEIDPAGNVVVAGHTRSTNYPTTIGAYDTVKAGASGTWDFVISKLTPDLAAASAMPGISLDKAFYNANDLLNIQVVDAASDTTGSADPIDVDITSYNPDGSPLSSYTVTLLETGASTGVFVFNDFVLQDMGPLSGDAVETEANGELEATFGSLSATAVIAPALRLTSLECYLDGNLADPCLDVASPRWGLDMILVEATVYPELTGPADDFDFTYLVDFGCDAPHPTVPDVSECAAWLTGTATDASQGSLSFFYPSSDVGSRDLTGRLYEGLNPAVGTLRAVEPLATVQVQPHATELLLDPIRDVTATTGFTVSGRLMDIETVPPSEISGQTITFDGTGVTSSLQSVLTEGVTFSSGGPIDLDACSVPASCDLDSIGGIDTNPAANNVVRLGVGDTITFPVSTVQVNLFIQDTGTNTFKYIVEEGDGSFQPEAESAGADPNVAIVQIISGYSPVGGDVVPNGIKQITITEVGGAPGGTVGIAAVLTLNPDGLPTQQHAINFEDLIAGPQADTFTINPGHYYSTGFAQNTDVDGLEVTAEFGGSPQYEADESDTQTYNVLANTAGLGGEGSQSLGASAGGSVTVLSCGANSDSDLDAICDNWESGGAIVYGTASYQVTADGGAQIGQRDIFVEIDCMTGFCPLAGDLNAVEAAFAAEGYTLHLVLDETNLVVRNPLHVWTDTDGDINNDYDNIKKNHFGTAQERTAAGGTLGQGEDLLEAKAQVFRYILFAQNINTLANTACGPSGQAELGGNDAIVSVGCTVGTNKFLNSPEERQGTLMHELGHMLGLLHGGGDSDNCKPNLISVMSYSRQMPWSYLSATTAAGSPVQWKVTFSRQDLASLNENAQLSEASGLAITSGQWSGITSFKIIWGKPGATPSVLTGSTGPNVNWNNAGAATESGVSQNINKLAGVLGCDTGTTLSTLQSYDEWTLIDASDLNFRDGGNIDGFVYPDPDTVAELTAEGVTQLNAFGDQFQGVAQPINDVMVGDPGISVFNQKSTIPIKFTLFNALGEPVTPADVTHIKLKIAPISSGLPPDGDYTEPISSNPASPGDQFTYNADSQMWEFHLGTKNMAANKQYSIKIIVDLGLPTETLLDHNGDGVTAVFALK